MSDNTTFTPRGNRIMIDAEDADKTESGLYLAASATPEQRTGKVVATGGRYSVNGSYVDPVCFVGDRVMFNTTGANKVSVFGKQYFLVRNEDVVGVYS